MAQGDNKQSCRKGGVRLGNHSSCSLCITTGYEPKLSLGAPMDIRRRDSSLQRRGLQSAPADRTGVAEFSQSAPEIPASSAPVLPAEGRALAAGGTVVSQSVPEVSGSSAPALPAEGRALAASDMEVSQATPAASKAPARENATGGMVVSQSMPSSGAPVLPGQGWALADAGNMGHAAVGHALPEGGRALQVGAIPEGGRAPQVAAGNSQSVPGTADEMLDALLQEMGPSTPAVRSVRVKEVPLGSASGGGQLALAGLSPEQQRWLAQAAEAMRMGHQGGGLPALTQGEAQGQQDVQARVDAERANRQGGELLGPLALRPGQQPDILVLRPQGLPPLPDGFAEQAQLRSPLGQPAVLGPSAEQRGGPQAVNAFWSERVQQQALGMVPNSPQVQEQGVRVMAGDGSLSHQDLLELEALRVQALRDAEAQVQRETQRRLERQAQQQGPSGAGSFQSAVGGNSGGQLAGGSCTPSQQASPLCPPPDPTTWWTT